MTGIENQNSVDVAKISIDSGLNNLAEKSEKGREKYMEKCTAYAQECNILWETNESYTKNLEEILQKYCDISQVS